MSALIATRFVHFKCIKFILILFVLAFMSACSTTTVLRTPEVATSTRPTSQTTAKFFLWSLAGPGKEISRSDACYNGKIDQIKFEYTGEDVLTWVLTLGLYTPRTISVWCSL